MGLYKNRPGRHYIDWLQKGCNGAQKDYNRLTVDAMVHRKITTGQPLMATLGAGKYAIRQP